MKSLEPASFVEGIFMPLGSYALLFLLLLYVSIAHPSISVAVDPPGPRGVGVNDSDHNLSSGRRRDSLESHQRDRLLHWGVTFQAVEREVSSGFEQVSFLATSDWQPSDLLFSFPQAYCVDFQGGLVILDLSDPRRPAESGRLTYDGNPLGQRIFLSDSVIYAACGADGVLYLIYVGDPASPRVLSRVSIGGDLMAVTVLGNQVLTSIYSPPRVVAVDVANPARPKVVQWVPLSANPCEGIAPLSDRYVAVSEGDGLCILDLEGPGALRIASRLALGGRVWSCLAVGSALYAAVHRQVGDIGVLKMDTSELPRLFVVDSLQFRSGARPRLSADGETLYISCGRELHAVELNSMGPVRISHSISLSSEPFSIAADRGLVLATVRDGLYVFRYHRNLPPQAPELISPLDGASIPADLPSLVWSVPADANAEDRLHFQVVLGATASLVQDTIVVNSRQRADCFTPRPPVPQGGGTVRLSLPSPLSDGRWYWRVRAWDGEVWGPYSEVWSFVVDTTPPVLDSLEFVDAVYGGRWYNPHTDSVATVRVWYEEEYAKLLGVFSSFLPDTMWVVGLAGGSGQSVTAELDFSGVSDGRYPVYCAMVDSAGNRGERVDTLCVDGTAPWGYWSDAPDTVVGGEGRVVRILGATDGEGCGVEAVYVGVFTSLDSVPTVRGDSVVLPTVPGVYYVRYFAVDRVGNRGDVGTDTVVVKAGPVLVVEVSDGVGRAELGSELGVVIRVGNEGNELARGVVVVDTLPEWVDLVGVNRRDYRWLGDRVLSWGIGDLGVGEEVRDTVLVRVRDGDHVPGGEVRLRHGVRVGALGGYWSWSWDETWVRGLDLELGLALSPPGEANVGSEVEVRCWWRKALREGWLSVEPEGLEWRFAPVESCRDTVWVFRVGEEGEHEVLFAGEDLVGERGEVRARLRVLAREFFEVDRNRLELGVGEVVGIRYGLLRSSGVRVQVYNVAGELVRELEEGVEIRGEHRVVWDGRDEEGRLVTPGLYLLYFEADGLRRIAKVLVTR